MKKLVFAAIAVVAFSGVSFANTIEEEIPVKESATAVVTDPGPEGYACDECYKYADSRDNGRDRQLKKWRKDMNDCYDANNCDNERFEVPSGPKPNVLAPLKP